MIKKVENRVARYKNLTLLLILSFLFYSCATYTPVTPEPTSIQSVINVGDTIKVTKKDGEEIELKVVKIANKEITGAEQAVTYNDIHTIEVMTVSGEEKTTKGIFKGIVLVAAESGTIYSIAALPFLPFVAAIEAEEKYHPYLHPGDLYYYYYETYEEYHYNTEKIMKHCSNECKGSQPSLSMYCQQSCWEQNFLKKYPRCASHKAEGYYSDGSYYACSKYCGYLIANITHMFNNLHEFKGKYVKTQWQKDRDECMELTKNEKLGFFRPKSVLNKKIKYYRNCLIERGYPADASKFKEKQVSDFDVEGDVS